MEITNYVQIIKTRDAELKGYKHLNDPVKSAITPLFELTRSRTTSKVPNGDIHRRLANIEEATDGNSFILDLTSEEHLMNHQIEDLLDDSDGFRAWTDFVSGLDIRGVIPVIHVFEDGEASDINLQVSRLINEFSTLAFRVPSDDENLPFYMEHICEALDQRSQLVVIIDSSLVTVENYSTSKKSASDKLGFLTQNYPDVTVTVCASSFPRSVTTLEGCEDSYGEINLLEWNMFTELATDFPNTKYGDYGSINPIQTPTRGGAWVPRVDYPLTSSIIYSRYRRNDGGYQRCARTIVGEPNYDQINCWGVDQIEQASIGEPNGKSPSFWISVRLNIHSTRKVMDLS